MIPIPYVKSVSMDDVIATSYRDYHVKGFDYICLKRTPTETVKLYFFDGDVSKMPEVVAPHDHRYDFKTGVVCGSSQNMWFEETRGPNEGSIYERFAYETPLNGGGGFIHVGQTRLLMTACRSYRAGQTYGMKHNEFHTIRIVENETVLFLVQYEDKVTDRPTLTFMKTDVAPELDALYRRFTPDQVLDKLGRLRERVPELVLPQIV